MRLPSLVGGLLCILSALARPAPAATTLAQTDFGNAEGSNITPFATAYSPDFQTPPSPGQYTVGHSAAGRGPGDWGGVDHTTGTGSFMLADGANNSGLAVVSYTTNAAAGWVYTWHGWVQNLVANGANPPVLSFRVNGVQVGTFSFTGAQVWREFTFRYTNQADGVKTFALHDNNTDTSANDFGLDDLSLSAEPGPATASFLAATVADGRPLLSVTNTVPARTAWVQRCASPAGTNWVTLAPLTDAYTNWTDTALAAGWTNVFYRLEQ